MSAAVTRRLLLDLCCGAGGAAMGYHRAGWDVVGVDAAEQPRYPFTFHRGDALTFPLDGFDAIHASPPCQAYTTMSNRWRGAGGKADTHPDLLRPTWERIRDAGVPFVIENVNGSHPRALPLHWTRLHGGMFGLGVQRPRIFWSNELLLDHEPAAAVLDPVGVYGTHHDGRLLWKRSDGSEQRAAHSLAQASEVMGIDWMTWDELREAIPPAYTEWIGAQLLDRLAPSAA